MMSLEAAMQLAFLLFCRLGGMALVTPLLASRSVPAKLRLCMLLAFTVVLFPAARAAALPGAAVTPATFVTETVTGFAIGLGSALVLAAAQAAGDFMAVQIGLQGASVLDPMTNVQVPTLGQFMTAFATLLLLAAGGHLLMLDAVAETLRVVPPGSALDVAPSLGAMARSGGELLSLGVLFAAPAIAATMLANIVLGILVKAAPAMNLLAVAFPLQIGAGLVTIGAALALTANWFSSFDQRQWGWLERFVGPMLGGG